MIFGFLHGILLNMDNRRHKEHIYEERSSYQLGDTFAIHEWILIPLPKDYGEDFLARIVEKEALTGHDFYIQLKGTDRVEQYKLKTQKTLVTQLAVRIFDNGIGPLIL